VERIRTSAHRPVRLATVTTTVLAACATAATIATPIATTTAYASTTQRTNASVSSASAPLTAPVVAVAATPSGRGYWRAASDGGVLTAGDAHYYGSATHYWHDAIVGMATTPNGGGYWLVDRRGAVFSFGNAPFLGSMGGRPLDKPIVGMAGTPNGRGYWLVASDGGIFAFNAPYRGSTGGMRLDKPIVGMSARADGRGYWLVASDGGIFAFSAPFKGSMGGRPLDQPVVGMSSVPKGDAYTLVASDGGLFRFGSNSPFYGSASNACPGAPAVGVATSRGATGYWIAFANARTYAFSPSTRPPTCAPSGGSKLGQMAADLLMRLNQERAARGLGGLQWDSTLGNYAASWSANMAGHGFRHSNIGSLLGPFNFVGENIAMGSRGVTAGSLHNAWMHSEGHRSNILNRGFTRVGIGVYCASNGSLWLTQDFGRNTSAGSPPASGGTPPVNPIVRGDGGSLSC
jgi:uncharacterized protein YkwD